MMQKLSYSDLENNTQDVVSVRISRDQFIFWYKNEKKKKPFSLSEHASVSTKQDKVLKLSELWTVIKL